MRSFVISLLLFLLIGCSSSFASDAKNFTALYDPSTGEITFKNFEAFNSPTPVAPIAGFYITSNEGNLIPLLSNPLVYPAGIKSIDFRSTSFIFEAGISDFINYPIVGALEAGALVRPGTPVNDLTLEFAAATFPPTEIRVGDIVVIPEPSTAALLLCCIVPAVARWRR